MVGLGDALREFSLQRLAQRVADLEGGASWSTVKCYAVLDTGLAFRQGVVDPATGATGEHQALLVSS